MAETIGSLERVLKEDYGGARRKGRRVAGSVVVGRMLRGKCGAKAHGASRGVVKQGPGA